MTDRLNYLKREGSIICAKKIKEIISESPRQTARIAKQIGERLTGGDVIALCGTLGTGKTAFSKGLGSGLNLDPAVPVTSPTYTIVNEYRGRFTMYHIDYYRINSEDEFYLSGLEEFFISSAVTVIEWADRFAGTIPEDALWIYLDYLENNRRSISFHYDGEKYADLISRL